MIALLARGGAGELASSVKGQIVLCVCVPSGSRLCICIESCEYRQRKMPACGYLQ